MRLRHYTPADEAACLAIFDSNTPEYFARHERAEYQDFLAHQGNRPYFVVEDADGTVVAAGGYLRAAGGAEAWLTWGMVARHRHRRGLGRFLLVARLERLCRELSASGGSLNVRLDTSQHTWPFFAREGFTTERITENGYAPGYHRYDMVLRLDATRCRSIRARAGQSGQ